MARHFQSVDSRYSQVSLGADYTMESHCRDHESYAAVTRGRRRRAKALLDFERHDDDELGFRKNDVITGQLFCKLEFEANYDRILSEGAQYKSR